MAPSSFCFLKDGGNNGLLGAAAASCVFDLQEVVTPLPQGLDKESRAICGGYPAIWELGSFIYIGMVLSPGCKNLGSS